QIAPPPALDSDEYAASFNETKRVGAIKDAERTEEQSKATIVFDLQNPHPMIFRILENRDLSLFEQARVMAIYDLATDDVMLAQFAGKLHFQSWRPITAIRRAELDGRDDTDVDLGWQAFLDTPNSSEYPCGHCTFVAASAEVLKVLLPLKDGEKIVITAEDMYHDPKERGVGKEMRKALEGYEMRYESWDAFAEAGGLSRIHNGAHFRYSLNAGMALGKSVAKANLQKWDGIED
ncbi:MAG: vanadium-dependent haloperoxidase, partial [Pseudomonadota bacterium]